MDFSDKFANNVEEAVQLALADLGVSREEVDVIVLEEPSRGFLGVFGSKLAKVRVKKKPKVTEGEQRTTLPQEEPVKKQQAPISQNKEKSEKKEASLPLETVEKREVKREEKKAAPQSKEESQLMIREKPKDLDHLHNSVAEVFLKDILEKMGLTLEIKVMGNDRCIYVDMEGKDSGTIIGKRGQTLDAIQYLTSLVVNKDQEGYIRVVVDAENYRQKRERTLEQLANRLADKVMKTKRSVRLEPMNPYERKVIHATLQSSRSVTTRSEGEEPYRRVVIELSEGAGSSSHQRRVNE